MKIFVILAVTVTIATAWEGCSHGFWKQNTEYWAFKLPEERFNNSFAGIGPSNSLIEALRFRHAKQNHLVREAVGALLNAIHPDIDYRYTQANVTDIVRKGFASQEWEYYAWLLEDASTTYKCPCKENCRKGESFYTVTTPSPSTGTSGTEIPTTSMPNQETPSSTITSQTTKASSTEIPTTSMPNQETPSSTITSQSTTETVTTTISSFTTATAMETPTSTAESPSSSSSTTTVSSTTIGGSGSTAESTEPILATGSGTQTILIASATASEQHPSTTSPISPSTTADGVETTTTTPNAIETTVVATPTTSSTPTQDSGLSPGAISAIVLGTFFGIGAFALAAGLAWRKCRS